MKIYKWSVTPSMDAARIIQFGVQKKTVRPQCFSATQRVLKQWKLGDLTGISPTNTGDSTNEPINFHLAFALPAYSAPGSNMFTKNTCDFGSGMEFPLECCFGKKKTFGPSFGLHVKFVACLKKGTLFKPHGLMVGHCLSNGKDDGKTIVLLGYLILDKHGASPFMLQS